jgi:prepilin-type N-terminal cleavage/methylation domain-containing protein
MMATRRKPGFTLIELVITVAIMVMMLTVAMPLFFQIMAQRRLTAAVDRVRGDLRYAQSQAVTQGGLFRLHEGGDAGETGKYRLEQSTDGGTTWTQLTGWYHLSTDYQGSSVQGLKDNAGAGATRYWIGFNMQGVATGPAGVVYPVDLTVVTPTGATKTIQILRTGTIRDKP